ncbi:transcriptional regulator, IclR family [Micromonospora pallida]|uniref:Glycerol operon regulatory protein n=1 Tax=Micromonospora pallida TaxID=145854 RepID=A0A1C6SI38_9ACTN|nr:IclR family transcriptional regulator [Micromonospora pallida]SCL29184.1 transcriptional regulator, IclR family [Micromonospora pallida]
MDKYPEGVVDVTHSGGVQSVARAFGLLEALGERGGQASLTELADSLGLALPTIHRLLRTLVSLGYVRQLPSRRYALGPGLIPLGDQATRLLAAWARPALEELEHAAQETANLAILDGDKVVYVAQVPSRHQMRMFTEVGRRVHPHSTGVGKALLAQIPDADVLAMVRRVGMPHFTNSTHTTESDLLADLATIRERGYSIDEGEQEVGVRCFAVAVPRALTPMAVSVSGPNTRVTHAAAEWMVPALLHAAEQLASSLVTQSD